MADPSEDTLFNVVLGQFNIAHTYATEVFALAVSSLTGLGTLVSDIVFSPTSVVMDMNIFNPDTIIMAQPVLSTLPPYTAQPPSVPILTGLSLGEISQLPTFDVPLPTITLPAVPSPDLPAAPVISTGFTVPVIPSIPSVTLPDVPVFNAIQLPDPPSDITVALDATPPVNRLVVPANAFSYNESRYVSDLLDSLRAWLSDEITNGGTGLSAQSQADIYAMETERDLQAIADAKDLKASDWARGGWSLPDGVLEASLFALDLEFMQRRMDKSRDIRVEVEKIAIQQIQFAITQANIIEATLINYENQVAQRSFESAKAMMDYALAVFDANLKEFQAELEEYKARASVYEIIIRAAIANIELYKATLDAAKVQVEIDNQYLELYNSQLKGVNLLIDIYKTEMDAARIQTEIQTLYLQAQKLMVDIYTAEVGAKVSEFNMYDSAVKGQLGLVQIYAAEVDAFKTQVEEAKIAADLVVEQARVNIEIAKAQIGIYSEEVASYKTQIDAVAVQIDQAIRVFSAQAGVYEADARVKLGLEDIYVKAFEARITQAKAEADIAIKNVEVQLQALVSVENLRMEAVKGTAEIASHLVAGAMAGAHAQASLSDSFGNNNSYSYSVNRSESVSV